MMMSFVSLMSLGLNLIVFFLVKDISGDDWLFFCDFVRWIKINEKGGCS